MRPERSANGGSHPLAASRSFSLTSVAVEPGLRGCAIREELAVNKASPEMRPCENCALEHRGPWRDDGDGSRRIRPVTLRERAHLVQKHFFVLDHYEIGAVNEVEYPSVEPDVGHDRVGQPPKVVHSWDAGKGRRKLAARIIECEVELHAVPYLGEDHEIVGH